MNFIFERVVNSFNDIAVINYIFFLWIKIAGISGNPQIKFWVTKIKTDFWNVLKLE